jgi:hypothetical protein
MTHGKQFIFLILLTISVLACKNEPTGAKADANAEAAADPNLMSPEALKQVRDSLAKDPTQTTQISAPASAKPISSMSKEQILLKDATQIALPKEGDKSSMVFFFATPAAKSPESTALSNEGLMQSTRLTRTLARVGITVVWVDGNTGMQTGLGVAKENAAEFNLLDPKTAGETLKTMVGNYMGKRILVVASPPVLSQMLEQLAGKKVVEVPSAYSPVLYYAKVRAMGDADIMELSY